MKKRTIVGGLILAATLAHANDNSEQYLNDQTGAGQPRLAELCLKVTPYSIVSMGPHGPAASSPIGLIVASGTSQELVILPNRQSGQCDEGYIRILTTAPLMSLRNAPVGL